MSNDSNVFTRFTADANVAAKVFDADSGPRTRISRNWSGATIYLGSTSDVDDTGYPLLDQEILSDSLGHSAVWAVCPTASLDVRRIIVQ